MHTHKDDNIAVPPYLTENQPTLLVLKLQDTDTQKVVSNLLSLCKALSNASLSVKENNSLLVFPQSIIEICFNFKPKAH